MATNTPPAKPSEEFHHDIVGRVILSLGNRLDETLTLSAIARVAFLSRFHFSRVFRQITGLPPCQFFYAMRIAEAKALLLTTRYKVIDVCYEVGYRSLGTFTRRFTELVGVSPSRFRLQARLWKQTRIESVAHRMDLPVEDDESPALCGTVSAPTPFHGLTFVGLFTEPIPQGIPVSCGVVTSSGHYRIPLVRDGTFYLFAMALPAQFDCANLFHTTSALRAGGNLIVVSGAAVQGATELVLRPPELFDPPILTALPPVLRSPLAHAAYAGVSDYAVPPRDSTVARSQDGL